MGGMEPYREYADELLARADTAARAFHEFDQDAVDRIVEATWRAAFDARFELAEMAARETGMGVVEHKVQKNAFASLLVAEDLRGRRTAGVVRRDEAAGITEIARPRGPILGFLPVTNPTSTAIHKVLIALKTRNPLILSAHRRARKCSHHAAKLMADAATEAGAPEGAIQWIRKAHKDYTLAVLQHPRLALALATSTASVVRMAQGAGKPAIGVGPGNVPVLLDESADLERAVRRILASKTFDHGVVCASEQALVVPRAIDARVRELLREGGTVFLTPEQAERLGAIAFDAEERVMAAQVVGQPATAIAEMAGIEVPGSTRLLAAEPGGVGADHPLSHEILAPVLAYYTVRDLDEGIERCAEVCRLGGDGHTAAIHTTDDGAVREFSRRVPAGRVLVNDPATMGSLGGTTNRLTPSLTLACGAKAGNIFLANVSAGELIEIQRVALPRRNAGWFAVSPDRVLERDLDSGTALDLYRRGAEPAEEAAPRGA